MNTVRSDTGLDPQSFKTIAELAYRESGLRLAAEKSSMIQSRLRHRLRALGLPDFSVYSNFVCSEDGLSERRHMISALTTNVSHFFREKHHFDLLATKILPCVLQRLHNGGRLRIWSAGCSNGQEACSIAMALLEAAPGISKLDVRILATDIDPNVVAFAKAGSYVERMVNGIPPKLLEKYYQNNSQGIETTYSVCPEIRGIIRYRELNLLAEWPFKHSMDIIFCRNVVIYFDQPTQNRLWPRFRDALTPNGYLFLGHSERIVAPELSGFASDGPTTYRPTASTWNR